MAVLEAAIRVAELAGEFDRGVMLAKAALRDIDIDAEPVRAALLLQARGHLNYLLGRPGYTEDLREAARLVPADPPTAARARVLEAVAHDIHHRVDWDDAEFLAGAEEAVAVARQAGDPATEAAALVTLACALPLSDDLRSGSRELLAEARAVATRARAYQPLLRTVITESDLLEGLGQHEQAAAVARDGVRTAAEYGLARTSGVTLAVNLAEPLVSLGRWDEAGEVLERARQLMPPALAGSSLWRLSGDMAVARGDLAVADDSWPRSRRRCAAPGTRTSISSRWPGWKPRCGRPRTGRGVAAAAAALDHIPVARQRPVRLAAAGRRGPGVHCRRP